MQVQTTSPVFSIDTAQGQSHAQAQIRWPAGERRERALIWRGLEVSAAQLLLDVEFLHGGGHLGHLGEILKAPLTLWSLGERPEVRELHPGDAATTVTDADDDVLVVLTDGDLDRVRFHRVRVGMYLLVSVDDGLDRVSEQFADDVLEVTQNVGEGRVEVALNLDLGDLNARTVGRSS